MKHAFKPFTESVPTSKNFAVSDGLGRARKGLFTNEMAPDF